MLSIIGGVSWSHFEVLVGDMSREIEVLRDIYVESVEYIGAVVVHSYVKLVCCAAYILFVASGAGDKIYNI